MLKSVLGDRFCWGPKFLVTVQATWLWLVAYNHAFGTLRCEHGHVAHDHAFSVLILAEVTITHV